MCVCVCVWMNWMIGGVVIFHRPLRLRENDVVCLSVTATCSLINHRWPLQVPTTSFIYIYIYSAVGDRHTRITPGTPAGIINLISRLLAPSIIGCLSLRTFQDNQRIIERPVGPIESAIERKIIISIISVIVNAFS